MRKLKLAILTIKSQIVVFTHYFFSIYVNCDLESFKCASRCLFFSFWQSHTVSPHFQTSC